MFFKKSKKSKGLTIDQKMAKIQSIINSCENGDQLSSCGNLAKLVPMSQGYEVLSMCYKKLGQLREEMWTEHRTECNKIFNK